MKHLKTQDKTAILYMANNLVKTALRYMPYSEKKSFIKLFRNFATIMYIMGVSDGSN